MKLNFKIILPILILLFVILASFTYLLFFLYTQEEQIKLESARFQQLNLLSQKLTREQEITEYNILVYRFNSERNALVAINDSELKKAEIIDEIYPNITTKTGQELVKGYIESRKNIDNVQDELIKAIDSRNEKLIQEKYEIWSSQTKDIHDSINGINDYNLKSMEEMLTLFDTIGSKIIQVILLLSLVVTLSTLILFFYLKFRITSPIIRLSRYADEIAEKNFSNISDDNLTRSDEIGYLYNAFTGMSKKLKKYYEILEKNVQERTVELTNRTVELENSQKAILNVLQDLNDEKKNLEHTKAVDDAVMDSIADCLVVVDKDGKIIFVNRAFESTTGWKEEEVIGKCFIDVIPSETEVGDRIPSGMRFVNRVLIEDDPESDHGNTVYYVRKDNTRFPVSSLVKRVVLDGKIIGAVKTFRDITEAKGIDQAKTEFVSLAAHQLRTPLSAISWYTEMLMSGDAGELSKEQLKYLEQIYNGNQRMVAMVKSFLNVSRIDMGSLVIENEQTDIQKLIEDVIYEQKQKIDIKKMNIAFDYTPNIPKISIDPKRIRMVFQNLLSNAIKYSSDESKIEIMVKKDEQSRNLLVTFKDQGFGIPLVDQPKIFNKLFRAGNVVEKDTNGTGLGLYIVKSIVENSKGSITFESEENVGSTFYVTLPL